MISSMSWARGCHDLEAAVAVDPDEARLGQAQQCLPDGAA